MYGRPFFSLYYAGLSLLHFPVILVLLQLLVKCSAVFLWVVLYLGFLFFLLWLGVVALAALANAYVYGWGCATGQICWW